MDRVTGRPGRSESNPKGNPAQHFLKPTSSTGLPLEPCDMRLLVHQCLIYDCGRPPELGVCHYRVMGGGLERSGCVLGIADKRQGPRNRGARGKVLVEELCQTEKEERTQEKAIYSTLQ